MESLAILNQLKAAQKEYNAETKAIRRKIADLNKKIKPYLRKLEKIERKRKAASNEMPYGMVHPGSNKSGDKGQPNGKLDSLFSTEELKAFLEKG